MTEETTTPEVDYTGAVALAYVHSERVSYSWHHSIVELMAFDFANDCRIARGGFIGMHCGTDGLVDARNETIRTFLEERQAEWLFWVDTDMGFSPDTLARLLQVADPEHRPIVGALAFSQRQTALDGWGGWRTSATPTLFDWEEIDGKSGFTVRFDYARNTVTAVKGTGSACILIHRRVFEAIADKFGPVWYQRIPNPSMGKMTSEDLSFCMRAGALGIPVHVHTGVQATHHKPVWLQEDDYLRQRAVDAEIARQAEARAEAPASESLLLPDGDV